MMAYGAILLSLILVVIILDLLLLIGKVRGAAAQAPVRIRRDER
jgi:hypothetical protein